MSQFENAAEYQINTANFAHFIDALVETQHFLVYTEALENDNVYIIASPSLYGQNDLITQIVRNSFSQAPTPKTGGDDYILILHPQYEWRWTGVKVVVPMEFIDLDMKRDRIKMVARFAGRLGKAKESL